MLTFMSLIAVSGWFALGLQFYLVLVNPDLGGLTPVQRTVKFFSYFTILSNLLVTLSLTICLLMPQSGLRKFFSRPTVKSAIAAYITIVGIVYSLVLRQLWKPEDFQLVADVMLHDGIPIMYVLYWFIFVPKGELNWKTPISWLIFPLIYLPYTLIRGAVSNQYPYPFVDVSQHGFPTVLFNSVMLLVGFFVMGEIFVGIDKLMSQTSIQNAS
ncbi:MAG: Pr6Pr family membrane protein [Pyrinomonadaceae bacterium]|nr:Pr6Pr family membrane protein [Pyrinomonadaceae bacterium]